MCDVLLLCVIGRSVVMWEYVLLCVRMCFYV
jgi:hypothetical protein